MILYYIRKRLLAYSVGETADQHHWETHDQIQLVRESIGWSACRGLGWRAGTLAVGGLGTVTHLNEGDIIENNGRVCQHQTNFALFCPSRNIFN